MTDLARAFARLERAKKVVLSGYPDGSTSTWHVQTSVRIGDANDNRRVTVLQGTEKPDQWMTVVLTEREGTRRIESIGVAEGEPPTDGGDESAVAVDPAGLDVVDTATARYSDRT